jgi:hypothetical protein
MSSLNPRSPPMRRAACIRCAGITWRKGGVLQLAPAALGCTGRRPDSLLLRRPGSARDLPEPYAAGGSIPASPSWGPYAEPLDALEGRSVPDYQAEHVSQGLGLVGL